MTRTATLLVLTVGALCSGSPARAGEPDVAMYRKALDWMVATQHPNGGFGQVPGQPPGEVGITGLVVRALATAPEPFRARARPAAERAAAFLLSNQQEDGSFTQGRSGLSTYRTAISISALVAVDRQRHRDPIARATAWLRDDQFGEEEGVPVESAYYGGFGYDKGGTKPDADLSNTLIALAALKDAGIGPDDPIFQRVQTFLSRCQNSSETNPAVGGVRPLDDGGFFYDPGIDRNKSSMRVHPDGKRSFESYASMTYGGLMSLLYAGVGRDDPRVGAALRWIGEHYTLEENYGLGIRAKDPQAAQQGLFYYYHLFAKCLDTLGASTVQTREGERRWARDLCDALLARQDDAGFFQNPNDRWWERDPVLVTAYVLNALNYALPHLED